MCLVHRAHAGAAGCATEDCLPSLHNADIAWDAFDPDDYYGRNYRVLLPEDRQILRLAGSFLAEHFRNGGVTGQAIDVGAGANLYPALLMLPWAEEIILTDVAESNVAWLSVSVREPPAPWPWQMFWNEISGLPGYRDLAQPENVLAARGTVRQRSIFDLELAAWDLGSMFFVADGMTEDPGEFEAGVESFVRALRPGAPFVAAFMQNSLGYTVGSRKFPAVSVDRDSLQELFRALHTDRCDVRATDRTAKVVRPGYEGMLVVTGLAGLRTGRNRADVPEATR